MIRSIAWVTATASTDGISSVSPTPRRMTSSAPFTARFPLFGPAVPTPTGARFPARCGYYSLCSVRKPRKRCGVFGVQWTPYLLTQHSTLLLSDASHVFGGWRHGPCHRPACPFCGSRIRESRHHENLRFSNDHGGQAQVAAGIGLRRAVTKSQCCRGSGTVSTRTVHIGGEDLKVFLN